MKNKLILVTAAIFLSIGLFAQAPNLINYQAVARDASGIPLISTPVNVLFEIRQTNPNGTVVYSETHASSTNQFGLFNIQIGGGTPVTGTFAGINWSTGLYYLYIEVNGDPMPATQLLSVPYALHANTATSGIPGANGHNGLSAITTEPSGTNCPNGGYLVDVGVDDNDDGILQALEVDFSYYVCNGLDGAANTSDTSATNELQTLSNSNDTIFLSNGGFIKLPPALGDNWGSQVVITAGPNIMGNGTSLAPLMVIDNDTSSTNELQNLSISGNTLNISGGAGASLSATAPNTGDYLYWNGVNWVAQAPAANTDNQNLINGGKTGNNQTINIQNGTGVTFSVADGDSLTTNEIQQLSFSNPTLSLSLGGGSINLSGLNTDAQTLSYTSATQNLSISNGNSVTLIVDDADADPTNELITNFDVNGTNDSLIIDEGGSHFAVPFSAFNDGDWTKGAGVTYNITDNVGIGTATPVVALDVTSSNTGGTGIQVRNTDTGGKQYRIVSTGSASAGGTGLFQVWDEDNTSARLTINSIGNVGLGTTSPTAKLQVANANNSSGIYSNTTFLGGTAGYFEYSNLTGGAGLSRSVYALNQGNLTNNYGVYSQVTGGSSTNSYGIYSIVTGGTNRWSGYFAAGNVYIADNLSVGTTSAFSKLDINGQITMRSGATVGYIPVSNANGTMTWTDPTSISAANDGDWTISGVNMYSAVTGNVGIGTTAPIAKLDVVGNNAFTAHTAIQNFANDNTEPRLSLLKSRGATVGTNVIVQNNDPVGRIFGWGADGSNYWPTGSIEFAVDGTPGASDMPGRIVFSTTPDGSQIVSERMRITQSGLVGIGTSTPATQLEVQTTSNPRAAQFVQNFASTFDKYGLYALAQGGSTGENIGVQGDATSATTNKAVVGRAFGGTNNWSGFFELGNFHVNDDVRIGATGTGTYNPKVFISTTTGGYTSLEADNQYNGNQTMYGYYNRMIATGTGGMAGTWHYMTPSASSSGTVYGFRSLIQSNGNGARYGNYNYVLANGTGEINGSYNQIDHDGSGTVYGFRLNATSTTTSGSVYGLYLAGPTSMINFLGGNTGIGIISPVNKLDVEGGAVIGASYSGTNTAPTNGLLVEGQVAIGTTGASTSRLYVNTSNNAYAGYFLDTRATGSNYGVYANAQSTSGTFNVGAYGRSSGAATTNYGLYGYASGGGTNYSVYALGDIYTAGSYLPSDERLKKDVQPFEGAIEKLAQLEIKTYYFKNDEYSKMNFPKTKQYGLIAQNLEKIFPEMIKESEHFIPNENGELTDESINIKAVNYDQLIPVLIKAVQEQQQMIDELKQEIHDLKNK